MAKKSNGKKSNAGRPEEFNDITVKKLEEVFAIDGSIGEACLYADITRQTYYNHVNEKAEEGTKEKKLFDRFQSLRNRPFLKARRTINQSLDQPQYAFEYMKRKRKHEFGDSKDITTGGKPIPILNLNVLSDDIHKEDSETQSED